MNSCQDGLGHLCCENWMALAQIGPEIKCPRVPVWVKGGGGHRHLGNARIEGVFFLWGFHYHHILLKCSQTIALQSIEAFLPVHKWEIIWTELAIYIQHEITWLNIDNVSVVEIWTVYSRCLYRLCSEQSTSDRGSRNAMEERKPIWIKVQY